MTDDMNEPPVNPPPSRLGAEMKKLGLTLVFLFALWLLFRFGLSYMETKNADAPEASPAPTPVATAPAMPTPEPEPKPEPVPAPEISDARAEALEARMAELERRVESLAARIKTDSRQIAAAAAFDRLKDAALSGAPFTDALERLREHMIHDNDPLIPLQPYADTGIPTIAALQQSFDVALQQALAARENPDSFSHYLRTLVRIRKVGAGHAGQDDEAVLARAEALLARGELKLALEALSPLSPPAADRFLEWKSQAEGRLKALGALEALRQAILSPPPTDAP